MALEQEKLRLYDSRSKKMKLFTPLQGNTVLWFECGPTLYDALDIVDIPYFISLDIIRRTMEQYFGYDILYFMNINDIHDKIIERPTEGDIIAQQLMVNLTDIVKAFKDDQLLLQHEKRNKSSDNQSTVEANDQNKLSHNDHDSLPSCTKSFIKSKTSSHVNEAFLQLARHYQSRFHMTMSYFDVLPPNVTMRVSDYILDIINFIQNVFEKGYAYELNSSVYFDIVKFRKEHPYESLKFYRMDNTNMSDEEQEILASGYTNANESNFVLWMTSESHQPLWPSPWGIGRPGAMIQCDLMCNIILDSQCDIHTGQTHSFPCYDNLIAQCRNNDTPESWCKFEIKIDEPAISQCKISIPLNDLINIQKENDNYSRVIRVYCLLNLSSSDANECSMEKAVWYENTISNFLLLLKKGLSLTYRENDSRGQFNALDRSLFKSFIAIQTAIHSALCDNINTETAMKQLIELITSTNLYMETSNDTNYSLLKIIEKYVTRVVNIFGLISSSPSPDQNWMN